LNSIGLSPEAKRQAERHVRGGPVCFETTSHYEITVAGRKLVGNSQVRRHKGLLQHGSLPLSGDVARVCDALVYPDETSRTAAKAQVRTRAITLAEAMGYELAWQTVAEALAAGFATLYEIDFVSSGLSADEAAQARQLAAEVYGSDRWTLRR
jgi:lipoate-protein ligase A